MIGICLQHTVNPHRVVLAGGMTAAGGQLLTPVRWHLKRITWKLAPDMPEVAVSEFGNRLGIVGAAACAWTREREGAA